MHTYTVLNIKNWNYAKDIQMLIASERRRGLGVEMAK